MAGVEARIGKVNRELLILGSWFLLLFALSKLIISLQ